MEKGRLHVNHAGLVGIGRDGVVFDPAVYDRSDKRFFEHPGFKDEEEVLKAAFKLVGKSEAEAEELYGSVKASLWKLIGRQFPVKFIDSNGKVDSRNVSLDEIINKGE